MAPGLTYARGIKVAIRRLNDDCSCVRWQKKHKRRERAGQQISSSRATDSFIAPSMTRIICPMDGTAIVGRGERIVPLVSSAGDIAMQSHLQSSIAAASSAEGKHKSAGDACPCCVRVTWRKLACRSIQELIRSLTSPR